MRRLRVLHVIGGLELGGAETLLFRLATTESPEFEHEVVCLGPPDWYSNLLEAQGVTVHHLGMRSALSTAARLARLRRLLRERGADVIQSWMYFANVLSGALARGSGVPVVWGIHASTFNHLGWPSRICAYVGGRRVRQLSSFVVNCSEHSAQAHSRFGYSAGPGAIIPNGYDPGAFFPDEGRRAATRKSLGLASDQFVIGTVARWHSEKDIPTLIEALERLRADRTQVMCLLIGPGLEASNAIFAKIISASALNGIALGLGRRADVADLYRAIDVHVLSSRSEAFPNVVAESMLSGTPNVVTAVGDSALMVGQTGWVVPPGEPEAMADAIAEARAEWSDCPAQWGDRREAARQHIAERFTLDRMIEAYQQVWRNAAHRR